MHSKSSSAHREQRSPSLLDPCYHLDKTSSMHSHGSHSPCPSTLSRNRDTTWVDETGEHDPDFRPFAVPATTVSYSPVHSPRRRSLDLPTKGVRGPLTLEPGLYAALRAHERVLAEQRSLDDLDTASHNNKRCESRRPSFLGRPRCRSRNSSHKDEPVFTDDSDDDSSLAAYSPPPLPELELDSGSDEDEQSEEKHGHDHDLKHQLAGLHLRVDLALFRVKKRLRRRVGLD